MKNGIVISDCKDDNAIGRQQARFAGLFGSVPSFMRLNSDVPDLEAAGNLIDVLDAIIQLPKAVDPKPFVVLVNVAPRGGNTKTKWDNGTPFCYFRVNNTLIVSTYEGLTLCLVRDLGIASKVELLDAPSVVHSLKKRGILESSEVEKIIHTQFRSLEFLPVIAYWLSLGEQIPSKEVSLDQLPKVDYRAWFVDSFGNVKTTLRVENIILEADSLKLPKGLTLHYYPRLADVPDGKLAVVEGSSGYGKHRFLEIIKQQGNAAAELGISVGTFL